MTPWMSGVYTAWAGRSGRDPVGCLRHERGECRRRGRALRGGPILRQGAGPVVGASVYAFVFTFGALKLINLVTPVRVTPAEEGEGLDETLHGERAYEPDAEAL